MSNLKLLKEHMNDWHIEKALQRAVEHPKKHVLFVLRYKRGMIFSFDKNRNEVRKALIVLLPEKHSKPTVIKLDEPLQEQGAELKLSLNPKAREIALYIKTGGQEYGEYFHPKLRKGKMWALFELRDGTYGILYDTDKFSVDLGYNVFYESYPKPYELMSMAVKPNFKFADADESKG